MTDELSEIFAAGAAAALANGGVGIWNNPHLPALVAAQKRDDPLGPWQEKVDAWEKGWEWRAAKLAATEKPLH
jgi:hypothetical protein